MHLLMCVCYMPKFDAGGLLVPITQTHGLLLVMLRWCLSDSTIQPMLYAFVAKLDMDKPHST